MAKSGIRAMLSQIATYKNAFSEMFQLYDWLPNPDIVLNKLGKTTEVYKELLADPYLYGCYVSRKTGTLKFKWDIETINEGNSKKRNYIKKIFERLDIYEIMDKMLDAPGQGLQVMEIDWEIEEQKYIPKSISAKPIEWFGFNKDGELLFKSKEKPEGETVPKNKFLVVRHNPSYKNPYGESILTKCYWAATFKKGGMKFWVTFIEKFGMPWVDVKAPMSYSDDQMSKLVETMDEMVQDGVIAHFENMEVDLKFGGATAAELYEKLIELCKQEISIAFTGHQNSNMNVAGKLGNDQNAMEVRADIIHTDKRMVEKTFNELINLIIQVNFGEDSKLKFVLYEEQEVEKVVAERDQILRNMGVRFSKEYYKKIYFLDDEDFEVEDANIDKQGNIGGAIEEEIQGAGAKQQTG